VGDANAFFVLSTSKRPAIRSRSVSTEQEQHARKRGGRRMLAREIERATDERASGVSVA
jgi:hypothetical protein